MKAESQIRQVKSKLEANHIEYLKKSESKGRTSKNNLEVSMTEALYNAKIRLLDWILE